jgi:hypothetical protein
VLRRSFDLLGTIKSAALVSIERDPGDRTGAPAARARDSEAVVAPHSAQSAAIVTAILIGDRVASPRGPATAAGGRHVSRDRVSGGNVALLTALASSCCVS